MPPNITACTRRDGYPVPGAGAGKVAAGGLEVSIDTHRVTACGIPVFLRPAEFRLLLFFMTHAERVHSRSQLLEQAWKRKVSVGERTVDVHIRRLRAALEPFGLGELIQTVHGSGYRFSGTLNESEKKNAEVKPGLCNRAGISGDPVLLLPA
jgi:DNA-binding response OmpR family regulator